MADVKGDLSGIAKPGQENPKDQRTIETIRNRGLSVLRFPDRLLGTFYGQQGHPVRTTVSEMGPLLLSRLLNLNEIQSGVLQLVFKNCRRQTTDFCCSI
jgi:DNA helicase HerA-like ATPase